MKYLDEYRNEQVAAKIGRGDRRTRHPAVGHHGSLRRTNAHHRQVRYRPRAARSKSNSSTARLSGVRHVAGDDRPGHAIASRPDVIFCSFGDMLRVPGSEATCCSLKSHGARRARRLFAARCRESRGGQSRQEGRFLRHRLRDHGAAQRDGGVAGEEAGDHELFGAGLARAGAAVDDRRFCNRRTIACRVSWARPRLHGHGLSANTSRSRRAIQVPIVITGFEPHRPARGCVDGPFGSSKPARARWKTSTPRVVPREGNPRSRNIDRRSVRSLRPQMARRRHRFPRAATSCATSIATTTPSALFEVEEIETQESSVCISGLVLRGVKKPHDCPAFGKQCTPETPAGRDDGFRRRCVCRVLRLRSSFC